MQVSGLLAVKGDEVVTVRPDDTATQVVETLAANKIGAVVVTADGSSIAGVLSERDIVSALAAGGAAALDQPVSAIMTTEVITCEPATTVDQLMSLMTERRIRHIPVLVEGRLAGLVSIGDVVRDRIADLETESQVLHDYIAHGR